MTTSREYTRDALVSLLGTALASLAQDVIGQKPTSTDLQGKRVLTAVVSAGSGRDPFTTQGNRSAFRFEIQNWVLATGDSWTMAQAEDRIDALEHKVAETLEANRRDGGNSPRAWDDVRYDGMSLVMQAETVQGVPYLVEAIPVMVKLARS
jgi:hypothetical protein